MASPSEEQTLVTQAELCADLQKLGLEPGALLVVHSSLSSMGWVLGGAETVVRSLLEVLGPKGTLVMPAATPQCADPATWKEPELPDAWIPRIRAHQPLFDVSTTRTSLGAIPETFRTWPGTLRSEHPLESVCARGALARSLLESHPLAFSEGPGTPFGRLHEHDAWILLLGVGFNRCTALHHAETLVENRRTTTVRFPVLEGGERRILEVPNVADDYDTHFPRFGERFVAAMKPRQGRIGTAAALLFPMRQLVDLATRYFLREL